MNKYFGKIEIDEKTLSIHTQKLSENLLEVLTRFNIENPNLSTNDSVLILSAALTFTLTVFITRSTHQLEAQLDISKYMSEQLTKAILSHNLFFNVEHHRSYSEEKITIN